MLPTGIRGIADTVSGTIDMPYVFEGNRMPREYDKMTDFFWCYDTVLLCSFSEHMSDQEMPCWNNNSESDVQIIWIRGCIQWMSKTGCDNSINFKSYRRHGGHWRSNVLAALPTDVLSIAKCLTCRVEAIIIIVDNALTSQTIGW